MHAVIFDLWNTLADWPVEVWAEVRPQIAERLGLTPEAFDEQWYGGLYKSREIGPLADVFAHFGAEASGWG